jgi:serine/threonine protein kinase/Tfp pilus assembly protein PilF
MTPHCQEKAASVDALSPDERERLLQILEAYLAEREKGLLPDPDRLVAEHPELAEPLKAYLASLDFLHQAAQSFRPSGPIPEAAADFSEKRLGDYAIQRQIGRGGMGIVYEAQQISLGRRVALKLLPFAAVLDQRQIARFQNEARAAAQLHHPNIVPVFGVGCERGVHYYAMQYVEGQTIAELIHELRRLPDSHAPDEPESAASRLARDLSSGRFAAGSEASQAGKPTPGEAGTTTEEAGLASETTRRRRAQLSTDGSTHSPGFFRSAANLGVQAAEALEHAHQMGVVHRDVKPSNLILDARGHLWVTDFGLAMTQTDPNLTMTGDLLGTLRYMSPEQVKAQRHVLDHRTDVYSLGVTLYELLVLRPAFGSRRREELIRQIADEEPAAPRQRNKAIPRDLETVVLKAMAKEPSSRYATAQELADDLRRFLEGKPTLARRPTLADRAGKWARRHKTVVGSAVLLTFVTLASLLASTLLIAREHADTKAALAEARESQQRAWENFQRAELYFRQARSVVDRFAAQHAEQLADVPGAELLRHELLSDALGYYRQFIAHARNDPALESDLAVACFHVGTLTEQIGDKRAALAAYEEAKEVLGRLVRKHPGTVQYRRDLALCYNNVGLLSSQLGETAEARQAYDEAIRIQRQLIEEHPDSAEFRSHLAMSHSNLGLLESQTNQVAEAEGSYRAALDVQEDLVRAHPDEPKYLRNLAVSYGNLGFLYSQRDPDAAERYYRDALSTQQQLASSHPQELKYQSDLSLTYNNLGALLSRNGRIDEAKDSYLEAIAIQERLLQKAPLVLSYRRDLAITHNNVGRVYSRSQQPDEAYDAFDQARTILEALVDDYPHELSYRSSLGGILNNQGMVLEQLERPEEAVAVYRAAIEHQRFAQTHAPEVVRFGEFLSKHYRNLGRALRAMDRPHEAARAALDQRELWSGDPQRLYRVAAELALAAGQIGEAGGGSSAEDESATQAYRDQAIATLREAIEAGFTQVDLLQENPELDSIRNHPEFGELTSQLSKRRSG